MTDFLFDLSFLLAVPVWLLMILAPNWRPTARVAASPLTVVPILIVYTALAIPVLPELWTLVSGPSVPKLQDLVEVADGAGALWAQIIAWDLLIGQWMFLESRKWGIHPLVMSPLLVLTILLSPFAFPVFLLLRALGMARATKDKHPTVPQEAIQ
ncbi:ABA4-like family protein [Streptomyces albipurpureus]|uniref:ABA4-like family protein n=1 Tax=Streptomyces albipurpureus TaxID=2897419 RepID=A0ABT0UPN5_9ACTN|nr:ABA4-like family protein [Streptomyces sp. CWNU-1]MCM2390390.1 ABA4-like family protein [Streptomyces sp. CWNU-1]